MSKELTQTIEVKTPLKPEQLKELLQQISDAKTVIDEETIALKEYQKEVKDKVDEQQGIIAQAIDVYRKGYTTKSVKCTVVYDKNIASFYDVDSGEKVEERPMTEAEQLSLTSNQTIMDAETFIREVNRRENEKGMGDE